MSVITVDGLIDSAELGHTLSHEHVFIDTSPDYRQPPPHIASLLAGMGVDLEAPITLQSLGFLRREPQWSIANQQVDDYEDMVEELGWAKRVGVQSLFDFTPIMAGRNPAWLRQLSREVGMHIVTGTGYYREAFHPPGTDTMSVDDFEERFFTEVTQGIEGTGVRAGLIGECGTTKRGIGDIERRVLIAAARVGSQTGVPVVVHTEGNRAVVLEVIDLLEANGASPERIHICHVNGSRHWRDIVERGVSIGHDCFGSTFSIDSELKMNPTDQERIDQVKAMFDAGWGHRVLVSNDICMKSRFHKYGGWGYDHIQTNLFPFFADQGFSDADLDLLFVQNPARLVETGR